MAHPDKHAEALRRAERVMNGTAPYTGYERQLSAALLDFAQSSTVSLTEVQVMKRAIAWANNSLFGSHGYFLSGNGGEPDEHHLDRPIEELKVACNRWYNAASLYATPEALREALKATQSATQRTFRQWWDSEEGQALGNTVLMGIAERIWDASREQSDIKHTEEKP